MNRSFWIAVLTFALVTSSLSLTDVRAAEIKSLFDLPAEPLDKALRDFAMQAKFNISYEPALVVKLNISAIKGEFFPTTVLSMMLAGTHLTAVAIDEHTIQVLLVTADGAPAGNASAIDGPKRKNQTEFVTLSYAMAGTSEEAQEVHPKASSSNAETVDHGLEEIVVTGSHIRGAAVASQSINIDREEIDRSGYTSISDLMLSVPQNFGGGVNPGTGVGNSQVTGRNADNPSGASVPNLRGLGTGSTLTLIDGHRMASGLTGGGADIGSIPLDAIDHVEIVTDSASAIYGSDAVAGVVNVILRQHYDGAKTSLSYGFAPEGGGSERQASQIFGTNWATGEAMIGYEYRQQDAVDARDRTFTQLTPDPYSLLPETKSNSITVLANQSISNSVSIFVDGLYIARDANHYLTDPSVFTASIAYPTTLRKYAVATGFNFDLFRNWKATLFLSEAEDATNDDAVMLTTPLAAPANAERLVGTMRGVEGNANGDLFRTPSGPVRAALGAGYRAESFSDALGVTSASLSSLADGRRIVRYAFGEVSVPLVPHSQQAGINSMDLIVSGRTERYSDFGGKTVPKVGLVYVPTGSLKLRSTWGRAFRAPNLYDTKGVQQLIYIDLPNSIAANSGVPTLVRSGGNPNLQPESADAWSAGVDYSAAQNNGVQISATFFDIKYKNRISQIGNAFTALTDPFNAYFVDAAPPATASQALIASYPPDQVFNYTGASLNSHNVYAIVDDRMINVARQEARGTDLTLSYRLESRIGTSFLFLNGTYLDLSQQNTPQSPEQTFSGLAFYPPKFRLRGGVTQKWLDWSFTGTANYSGHELNTQISPAENVDSWTTVDASIRYAPTLKGVLGGVHASLAVINLLNKNPPYLQSDIPGLNYDSSNANPLGRFVTLQVSKEW